MLEVLDIENGKIDLSNYIDNDVSKVTVSKNNNVVTLDFNKNKFEKNREIEFEKKREMELEEIREMEWFGKKIKDWTREEIDKKCHEIRYGDDDVE